MSFSARAFITVVFGTMALSFVLTTAVLAWEFRAHDWLTIANFYSHLFIFFPTFGIVTLIAFYTPACVFVDLYLHHVPWGQYRFIIGFIVLAAASIGLSQMLVASEERSIFEIRPETLAADKGERLRCPSGMCERLPVVEAMNNVRRVSQARVGLSDLARHCKPDALKAAPTVQPVRYCFVSTRLPADLTQLGESHLSGDRDCCFVQENFTRAVNEMAAQSPGRSMTGTVHAWLLPFKIFFGLMLLVISIMLAVRRHSMQKHYGHYMTGIERGVLIGAAAMVVYPVMSHAFLQSAALLYYGAGPTHGFRANAPYLSFAFGCWGLLLLFFFYSRRDKELQQIARMSGVIGSAVAVVKYDQIVDVSVRAFGSGASWVTLVFLFAAAVAALYFLVVRQQHELEVADEADRTSHSQVYDG